MPVDDVLLEGEEKMEKTLTKVTDDFAGVRTGKASPGLVENINVDCYGTKMKMRELGAITTPEARLIVIQPWDASNVDPVRKAIEESNIGVTPMIDGKIIRLPLPELSEERRKELVKIVKSKSEDGRVAIRHHRREMLDALKAEQKGGDITEDDLSHGEKEVQKLTDKYVKSIDDLVASKEKDLMKV